MTRKLIATGQFWALAKRYSFSVYGKKLKNVLTSGLNAAYDSPPCSGTMPLPIPTTHARGVCAHINDRGVVALAIAAAQAAGTGAVDEVDLELLQGRLVFNADIGDEAIKVDAMTGRVIAKVKDD